MTTIALDARTLFAPTRRGTGKNLLDAYRALARVRPQWRFIMYHRCPAPDNPFAGLDQVQPRRVEIPGDRLNLWEELRLPLAAHHDHADLLHCPANSCPRRATVPVVSTVHDLIPLKVEDPLTDAWGKRFRARVRRCLRRSARVIAVSQSTRRDLIELGGDPQRIDVLTWAADAAYAPVRDDALLAAVRVRYGIRGRYLLAFSGRSRRKNADGMIRAYASLPPELRAAVQFVLIGVEPSQRRAELQALIAAAGLAEQCRVHGFAPEGDIPVLLSAADGLTFCSLYEGFGLPILDAFCCATPVLTSDCSSMPEIAADAALYCNPRDTGSMAEGMRRLLTEPDLRADLVCRGADRLRGFTWQRTAETMAAIFEKALG